MLNSFIFSFIHPFTSWTCFEVSQLFVGGIDTSLILSQCLLLICLMYIQYKHLSWELLQYTILSGFFLSLGPFCFLRIALLHILGNRVYTVKLIMNNCSHRDPRIWISQRTWPIYKLGLRSWSLLEPADVVPVRNLLLPHSPKGNRRFIQTRHPTLGYSTVPSSALWQF